MEYHALTFDLPDALYQNLKQKLSGIGGILTAAFSLRDAMHRCEQQTFHIAVLKTVEPDVCQDFIYALRGINSMPIVILLESFHADAVCPILINGADLCVPSDWPSDIIAEHIIAAFRRYTKYNHYSVISGPPPFQEGDISIDPARHIVEVSGRPVSLRPREFSLLLYFMQNPGIILSPEQICEEAWGTGGIYNRGIAQPIRLLRQAIEPDPHNPIYIETIRLLGYRFTAKRVGSCRT